MDRKFRVIRTKNIKQFFQEWLKSDYRKVTLVKMTGAAGTKEFVVSQIFSKKEKRDILVKCRYCGEEFLQLQGKSRIYCSNKCAGQHLHTPLRAQVIELWIKGKSTVEIAKIVRLSKERVCQFLREADNAGQLPEPFARRYYNRVTPDICRQCGKPTYHAKYCSRKCVESYYARKNKNSCYHIIKLKCSGCGCKFERTGNIDYISNAKNKTGMKFCSLACYRKNGITKCKLWIRRKKAGEKEKAKG